ncbi:MAG: AzlD domain-containing protein [Syntrophomonadaceae bacterium]|jgi:branched-subunit amino acid transport protein
MSDTDILLMIFGVSAVSLLPRILPVALLSRLEFPQFLRKWLSFVPPAVLGGLVGVSILAPEGFININPTNLYLWAAIPTFIVAIKLRSLFYTLLVGIITMAILYNFFAI